MKMLDKWRAKKDRPRGGGGGAIQRRDKFAQHDDLFAPLARFQDEMNKAFERVWRGFGDDDDWNAGAELAWPAVDMAEDDKQITLRVDVPGLGPDDVEVELSGNQLVIKGRRDDEWEDKKGGVYRKERRCGSFTRALSLPAYADAEHVEARYDKGLLTLAVPKLPDKAPKRVKINA